MGFTHSHLSGILVLLASLVCCISAANAEVYKYDLAGRLTLVTYSDGSTISYSYDPAGNITQTARGVLALPPDGVIDTPDAAVTIIAGDAVDFTGTGGDPDNQLPLTYLWEFDGAADDSTEEDPGPITFADEGTYTVEFTVTDALGLADPTPATRTITVNAAPVDPGNGGGGGAGSGNGGESKGSGGGSFGIAFLLILGSLVLIKARGALDATRISLVALLTIIPLAAPAAEWRAEESGTLEHLTDIWGSSATDVFAVGNAGTIIHYDGNVWSAMNSGTTVDLNAVYGYSASNVYVMGDAGTILHFDGNAWSPFTAPVNENGTIEGGNFVGVWTAGAGSPLYVITTRRAYYYDAGGWTQRSFANQFSATFTPASELRAIGGAGTNVVVAARPLNADGAALYANFNEADPVDHLEGTGVFGVHESDIYLTGNASVRFMGGNVRTRSNWKRVNIMSDPLDVWGATSDAAYAVGKSFGGRRGAIAYYDGNPDNTWVQSLDTAGIGMTAIWGSAADDVIAVGESGTIYRLTEAEAKLTAANFPQSGWLTDTINAHTGELVLESIDLHLGGSLPVAFGRYYASGLNDTLPSSGHLGRNWSHIYEWSLVSTADTVTIFTPRGKRLDFTNSSGEWVSQTELETGYQLLQDSSIGRFELLDEASELIYRFYTNTGRLEQIRNRVGNRLFFEYVANFDPPVSISDGQGRSILLQYDANFRLRTVTAGGGNTQKTVTFDYDNGNLLTVTGPGPQATRYLYDADVTAAKIVAVEMPSGDMPFTWSYDSNGQVETQAQLLGGTYRASYQSATTPSRLTAPDGSAPGIRHDDQGRVTAMVDEDGFAKRFTYTASGQLASVIDKFDIATTMEYYPQTEKLKSVTGPDNRTMSFEYIDRQVDGFSFADMSKVLYPDLTTVQLETSSNGLVTATTDRSMRRWEYGYDTNGNVTSYTSPASTGYSMTYNSDGTLALLRDPAGNEISYGYDGAKRLAVIRYPGPGNLTKLFGYDENDRVTSITNEAGTTTTLAYHPNGELASIDAPMMPPMKQNYDAMGRLFEIVSPSGGKYTARFDDRGRPFEFEDPTGDIDTLSYDNVNQPSGLRGGMRPDWTMKYTREGVPTQISFAEKPIVDMDSSGSPLGYISAVKQDGIGLDVELDEQGRVTAMTNGEGDTVVREHAGPAGQLSRLRLADPMVSSDFRYNDLGQLTTIRDANGNDWTYEYDLAGRQSAIRDPLGRATTFTYDARNRVNNVVFPGALGNLSIVKHPLGNDKERNFSGGESLVFEYDDFGRLTAGAGFDIKYDNNGNINQSNGIAIAYDAADKIETVELAPGKTITYFYDERGMVIGVRDWLGDAVQFSHDDMGRLLDIDRADGTRTELGYDLRGRLSDIQVPGISSISLQYRNDDLIMSEQRNVPQPAGLTDIRQRNYTHDAASQINEFSYDALGRRTSDSNANYTWTPSGRLAEFASSEASTYYQYDGIGLRTQRTEGGRTVEYVWNYALALPSVSVQREAGTDVRYFVHTPKGDLLYSIEANGNRRFYHYDENGNTLYITGDSGQVVASYAYSPYGELLGRTGAIENEFTFGGQRGVMQDGDLGLYYMRARYFDAESGRFLSRDPRQGTTPRNVNPYQYARGNPLTYRDPTGHEHEGGDDSLLDMVWNKVGDIANSGLGVASALGLRHPTIWQELRAQANSAYAKLRNANNRLRNNPKSRGPSVFHMAAQRNARPPTGTTVRAAPVDWVDEIWNAPKAAFLSGFVAMVTENSQAYTSTGVGQSLSKAGIFFVNSAASIVAKPAAAVGISTVVDVVLENTIGWRPGLHEVLNTPFRAVGAIADDVISEGNDFGGSNMRNLYIDLRNNRGQASRNLIIAGELAANDPVRAIRGARYASALSTGNPAGIAMAVIENPGTAKKVVVDTFNWIGSLFE